MAEMYKLGQASAAGGAAANTMLQTRNPRRPQNLGAKFFGAAEAQAREQTGQMLTQGGEALANMALGIQRTRNETEARNTEARVAADFLKMLRDPKDGVLTKEGAAAEGITDQFMAAAQASADAALGSASSPAVRDMLASALQNRVLRSAELVAGHELKQGQIARERAREASVAMLINDAASTAGNDDQLDATVAALEAEVVTDLAQRGLDPNSEFGRYTLLSARSKAYTAAVDALTASNNPQQALALLERVKEHVLEPAESELRKSLKAEVQAIETQALSQAYHAKYRTLDAALTAIRSEHSGKEEDTLVTRTTALFKQEAAAQEARNKNNATVWAERAMKCAMGGNASREACLQGVANSMYRAGASDDVPKFQKAWAAYYKTQDNLMQAWHDKAKSGFGAVTDRRVESMIWNELMLEDTSEGLLTLYTRNMEASKGLFTPEDAEKMQAHFEGRYKTLLAAEKADESAQSAAARQREADLRTMYKEARQLASDLVAGMTVYGTGSDRDKERANRDALLITNLIYEQMQQAQASGQERPGIVDLMGNIEIATRLQTAQDGEITAVLATLMSGERWSEGVTADSVEQARKQLQAGKGFFSWSWFMQQLQPHARKAFHFMGNEYAGLYERMLEKSGKTLREQNEWRKKHDAKVTNAEREFNAAGRDINNVSDDTLAVILTYYLSPLNRQKQGQTIGQRTQPGAAIREELWFEENTFGPRFPL